MLSLGFLTTIGWQELVALLLVTMLLVPALFPKLIARTIGAIRGIGQGFQSGLIEDDTNSQREFSTGDRSDMEPAEQNTT